MFCLCIISHRFGISDPDYVLDRQDGFMLMCFFAMFIFYIISVIKAKQGILEYDKPKYGIVKAIIYTVICCLVIIFSSDLVVDNAVVLADLIGVNTKITSCNT